MDQSASIELDKYFVKKDRPLKKMRMGKVQFDGAIVRILLVTVTHWYCEDVPFIEKQICGIDRLK
jgi:hypothetical protein